MSAERIFDDALPATTLPPRHGIALDELARTWAPARVAPAVELAVRMARRGDAEACLAALHEAERIAYGLGGPVHGCMSCGAPGAWHGQLCAPCEAEGWDEVGCPTCGTFHLQRPDGYVLGGCRWALDQNDRLPERTEHTAEDEADMRQQELLELREEP